MDSRKLSLGLHALAYTLAVWIAWQHLKAAFCALFGLRPK